MGLETMMVLGAVGMVNTAINTNEKADAAAVQANKTMENMTTDVLARLGQQKASFIGSGIALDADTGVYSVLNNTISTGIEDLDLFRSNAKQQIDNIYSQGLTEMIGQGITMGQMAGVGTGGTGGTGGLGGLGSLFGGGGATSTAATTTSATTGANTGGTAGFANLTNLFNFGG